MRSSETLGKTRPRFSSKRLFILLLIIGAAILLPARMALAEQQGRIKHDMAVGSSHDVSLKAGQVVSVLKQSGQTVVITIPAADGSQGIYQIDATAIDVLAATPPSTAPSAANSPASPAPPSPSVTPAPAVASATAASPSSSPAPSPTVHPSAAVPPDKTPQPAPPSELAAGLKGHLIILDNGNLKDADPASLQGIKYWAVYFSASWCPDCVPFTPKLVRFYKDFKADHPNFELILVCHDKTADAMANYIKSDQMPWPALRFSDVWNTRLWPLHYIAKGIPNLVLVDDTGKVLSQTYQGGTPRNPEAVIDDIKTMVPASATQL